MPETSELSGPASSDARPAKDLWMAPTLRRSDAADAESGPAGGVDIASLFS